MSEKTIIEQLVDGMKKDEWYEICQWVEDYKKFSIQVAAIKKQGLIAKIGEFYFHSEPADKAPPAVVPVKSTPSAQEVSEALAALQARMLPTTVQRLDLKLQTLHKLAELMHGSIATVLEDIAKDLTSQSPANTPAEVAQS